MTSRWRLIVLLLVAGVCLALLLNKSWRQKISSPGDIIGSLFHRDEKTVALSGKRIDPEATPASPAPDATPPPAAAPPAATPPANPPSQIAATPEDNPPGGATGGGGPGDGKPGAWGPGGSSPPGRPTPGSGGPAFPASSNDPGVSALLRTETRIFARLASPLNFETIRSGDSVWLEVVTPEQLTGDRLRGNVQIQRTGRAAGLALSFESIDHRGSDVRVDARVLGVLSGAGNVAVNAQGLMFSRRGDPLRVSLPAGATLLLSARAR